LAFRKKNLLYANDLDTLLPNYLVSKISSIPLVYDSHEYFTEVPELENRHFVKSVWEKLEAVLFPKLKNVITVNEELAGIYSEKYKVPVSVIRNVPIKREGEGSIGATNKNSGSKDLLIYQGALNVGRGIELMIDSMAHLPEAKLLIAGDGDIAEELTNRVRMKNLGDRVVFKGRLDPDDLKKLTLSASLGLSLEEDLGLNYRYALPNKIFDYIHAEIPVIVSDLPVMGKLVEENGVGEILKDRTPQGLAELVQQIVLKKESYSKHLEAAADRFNWNLEKKVFLTIIENLE
jgi:glycosyltransferase involved in cell wall biosynthesis